LAIEEHPNETEQCKVGKSMGRLFRDLQVKGVENKFQAGQRGKGKCKSEYRVT